MQNLKRKESSKEFSDVPLDQTLLIKKIAIPLSDQKRFSTASIYSALRIAPKTSVESYKKLPDWHIAARTFNPSLMRQAIKDGFLENYATDGIPYNDKKETALHILIRYLSASNKKVAVEIMGMLLKKCPDLTEIADGKGRLPHQFAKKRKLDQNIIDLLKEPWPKKFEILKIRACELVAECKSFTNTYAIVPTQDQQNLETRLQKNFFTLDLLLDEMMKLNEIIKIEKAEADIIIEMDDYLSSELYQFSKANYFSLVPVFKPNI